MVRKKTVIWGLMAGVTLLLLTGCSAQVSTLRSHSEPMHLRYDINYVDQTAVSIDLMVIASERVSRKAIARDLDQTVNQVARDLPKSKLLGRQDSFRAALNNTFAQVSKQAEQVRLVVLGVVPTGTSVVAMR